MSQSSLLLGGYTDKVRNATINAVAEYLAQKKSCLLPGQRLSSKLYTDAMQCLEGHNIFIEQETLKKRVTRASNGLNPFSSPPSINIAGSPSSASTLTGPSVSNTTNTNDRECSEESTTEDVECVVESSPPQPKRKAGRPKGSTMLQKLKDRVNTVKCVNTIAHRYAEARDAALLESKRIGPGVLESIIKTTKKVQCD